jgi:hypothetical protein
MWLAFFSANANTEAFPSPAVPEEKALTSNNNGWYGQIAMGLRTAGNKHYLAVEERNIVHGEIDMSTDSSHSDQELCSASDVLESLEYERNLQIKL